MTFRNALIALALLSPALTACASTAPSATEAPSVTVTAPVVVAAEQPALRPVPGLADCDWEVLGSDELCPEEAVYSAALSYLGKPVAMFDGEEMVELRYEESDVISEAMQEPTFRSIMRRADSSKDGVLDVNEAAQTIAFVFDVLEG